MGRHRSLLLFIALGFAACIPLLTYAAVVTPGPGWSIVPDVCNCPGRAAGWGCVIGVMSNIIQFAIYLGILICVLMAAYAGFLWVLNPVNPENRATGRKMLMNAAIGLVLTLAAWLIVNTLLNVLGAGGIAGTTSVLGGGPQCLEVKVLGTIDTGTGGGGGTGGGSTAGCPSGTQCSADGACMPTSGTNTAIPCGNTSCTNGQTCKDASTNTCDQPQTCTPPGKTGLDIDKAVASINSQPLTNDGHCLRNVRRALAAGGINLSCGTDEYAGQCNGPLGSLGFQSLGGSDSGPQAGDIIVVSPVGKHTIGHIAMWNGSNWVSDFVQSNGEQPPGCPYGSTTGCPVVQYWRP